MNEIIYVLEAIRHGIREEHSYTFCAFTDKKMAIDAAEQHCNDRGGKYSVIVHQFTLNDANGGLENTTEVYRAKGRFDNPEYLKAWTLKRYPHLTAQ